MASGNLDSWVKKLQKTSVVVADYMSESQPDDSFGWGSRVSMLANSLPDGQISGLLITGPDGCGKHTCAAHMINSLRSKGYGIVFMSGEDATACCKTGESVSEGVSCLLDDFYNRREGLCLVLERFEKHSCREELYSFLGTTVCEYHLSSDALPPLFVVLIEKEPVGVPALLRSRLLQCNMIIPTYSDRVKYLKNNAVGIMGYVDMNRLAAGTEGFTYSQLFNLIKNLTLEIDANDLSSISGEALDRFIEICYQSGFESGDKLTLMKKAEALIDMLPPIISQLGKQGLQLRTQSTAAASQSTAHAVHNVQNDFPIGNRAEWEKSERNKFENMPVQGLLETALNEAEMQHFMANVNS